MENLSKTLKNFKLNMYESSRETHLGEKKPDNNYTINEAFDSCDEEIQELFGSASSKYCEDSCSMDSMNCDHMVKFRTRPAVEALKQVDNVRLFSNFNQNFNYRPTLSFSKMRRDTLSKKHRISNRTRNSKFLNLIGTFKTIKRHSKKTKRI